MDMVSGGSKPIIEKIKYVGTGLGLGFRVLGLSKPIIQPTQLGFGLSLAGVWQYSMMMMLLLSVMIKETL